MLVHQRRDPTLRIFDARLYRLPDCMEVINNMDLNSTWLTLSSMQLWEVQGSPVVIEASGEGRIFLKGWWRWIDPWHAVSHGRPMSFQMFEEKWPGLVSVDEYLSSFDPKSDDHTI